MAQNIFIANLKKYRLAKGLTQEQVADTLHLNTQTVSRWECGTTLPDVLTLPVLAELYGITVDDLYKNSSIAYDNYAQRLASVYEDTRSPDDFMRCLAEYEKLQQAGKLSLADKWNLAMLHQFMMDYCIENAMKWYDDILTCNPDEDPFSYNRACACRIKLFFAIGKGNDILNHYKMIYDSDSSNPRTLEHLLRAYLYANRTDEAYACFKEGIMRFSDDWTLFIIGGDICRNLGKYEEAIALYDKAGDIGTAFCDELYSKAFCYEALGKHHDAAAMYLRIAEILRGRGFDVEADMAVKTATRLKNEIH
ncbi:MAG: helix-turn-helix domain-containing protein [Oscillospiraceae bacterium]|nr:helix-turn-helix domain-containing protein [Oscillospiraceae bacterium]